MENTNNLILLGYRHPSCKLYTPLKNKKKVGILILTAIPFLLTIGTNWIYFLGLSLLNKFNPLWIYR